MGSSNISSFYRQEKKATTKKNNGGGISIANAKLSSMIGSDLLLPLSSVVSSTDQIRSTKELSKEETEEKLKQFDMDMRYGPSVGLTRIERWDRASVLGLCPPSDVESLLLATSTNSHCLWQSRV